MDKKGFKERIQEAGKVQWLKFAVVASGIIAFWSWSGAWWLFLLLPLVFDIYVTKYVAWSAWKESKNPVLRKAAEWIDAIVFALIAVYIINIYFFQNYKIPSPSLEKTLLVGDFLFVSKMSYGPRSPMTPLSFPLAQHTIEFLGVKSYIEKPQWEYKRLEGFGSVERNDIVVFNFPAGDTVALKVQNPDYYTLVHECGRDAVWNDKAKFGEIVVRPVDRRENYVKRCVGLPGDSLQIKDGVVYVNGVMNDDMKGLQQNYFVEMDRLLSDKQFEALNIRKQDRCLVNSQKFGIALLIKLGYADSLGQMNYVYRLPLTKETLGRLEQVSGVVSIKRENAEYFSGKTYPLNLDNGWTRNDYGPIWIPKRGETIRLTVAELPLYERIIRAYEKNTLEVKDEDIYINGEKTDSYTFKMDYYWMMGDNRDNSADSRYWGYVPEDHIVGKPLFIWLSLDEDKPFLQSFRWNRMFTKVHPN